MSRLHNAFIEGIANANEVVLDAEEHAQRWAKRRCHLVRIAHLNGVSIDELATGIGLPAATVQIWLENAQADATTATTPPDTDPATR